MMKNLMDCTAGVLAFMAVGYSIGFGAEALGGFFSWDGFGIPGIDDSAAIATLNLSPATFFFFQAAFAATAATIVSGAMAERTKFKSYFAYSLVITAFIYPVILSWTWGGGWLAQLDIPFSDFGRLHHRPRHRRLGGDDGRHRPRAAHRQVRPRRQGPVPSPGHSIVLVVLGALILFIGWFGFQPRLRAGSRRPRPPPGGQDVAGGVRRCGRGHARQLGPWTGKPDVSMAANGLLAGSGLDHRSRGRPSRRGRRC